MINTLDLLTEMYGKTTGISKAICEEVARKLPWLILGMNRAVKCAHSQYLAD